MVDYKHPGRPEERLSHAEREWAVAALRRHAADGRITPEEFDERSQIVASAKTWHDLTAPFADLPELPAAPTGTHPAATHDYPPPDRAARTPAPGGPPAASRPFAAAGPGPVSPGPESAHAAESPDAPPDPPHPDTAGRPAARAYGYGRAGADRRHGRRARPLGGRIGATIMAITPIAAVVLFFLTGLAVGYEWAWLWFLSIPLIGAIIYAPWYEEE
jgi:hypothetical protein